MCNTSTLRLRCFLFVWFDLVWCLFIKCAICVYNNYCKKMLELRLNWTQNILSLSRQDSICLHGMSCQQQTLFIIEKCAPLSYQLEPIPTQRHSSIVHNLIWDKFDHLKIVYKITLIHFENIGVTCQSFCHLLYC